MITLGAPSETTKFFKKINKINYLLGLPNLWVEDVEVPFFIQKFHKGFRYASNFLVIMLIFCEWIALFTQKNLTEKQASDCILFGVCHPFVFSYVIVIEYHQERITKALYELVVALKEVNNDSDIEKRMISKAMYSASGFTALLMMALVFYGYNGIMQVLRGGTFTTLITFWPDVTQTSPAASTARLITYLMWWFFMSRFCAVHLLVIPTMVCLSHQFMNLQSYFYSLKDIFEEEIDSIEVEQKYKKAFKVGIEMHSKTLRCTSEFQTAFNVIFSNQVLTTMTTLVLLMSQMMNSERTLENILSNVTCALVVLLSNGICMCTAGDVTVEAADLATAVYSSGWARCKHASPRVRRLVVIVMMQAQKPVILWALGNVPLSYQSYVSIVKSSYSVFSVLF